MTHAPLAFAVPGALLLLILATLSAVTARRGWVGSLPRSGKLGVHSIAAASSDDAFAVANKVAAPAVGGSAAIAAVLGVLVLVLPVPTLATVVIGVIGLAATLVTSLAGGILGEQAARTLPVPARRPRAGAGCDGCACGGGGCAGLTRTAPGTPETTDVS